MSPWEPWEPSDCHYSAMQVSADLAEPIVYSDDLMHLDGFLAAAAFADLPEDERRRVPPLSSEWVVDVPVPLGEWRVHVGENWQGDRRLLRRKRSRRGRDSRLHELWGWRASAESASWPMRGVAEVRKRPELDAMRRYGADPRVTLSSGALKGYDLRFPTVFAMRVIWYAYGDLSEVTRLLTSYVDAIGKKRGHGWGRVSRWHVIPCASDRSVQDASGRLCRRMPAACLLEGTLERGSIRPPYHHASRVVDAIRPLPSC